MLSPITGIVSPRLSKAGETVVAGSSIAEIFDEGDTYIYWYIPRYHFANPEPGNKVLVLSGWHRMAGTIADILAISDDEGKTSMLATRESVQIAKIRLDPGTTSPVYNSTVYVDMYYTNIGYLAAVTLANFFALR